MVLTLPIHDYYMYTLDKFLQKRALPFMEQAALFYEDSEKGLMGNMF